MTETRYCSKCGNPLPDGAQFCSRCGAPADAPAPVVVKPSRSTYFIWVPIAIIALALGAWALLAGMPFGRDEPRRPAQREMDVVEEREGPVTGTVSQIGDPAPVAPQRSIPQPQPPRQPQQQPRPRAPQAAAEITESQAVDVLRTYIASRRDYAIDSGCIAVSSLGYENAGYTLDVSDRCGGKSLGRWRVDSKNRDVFRQRQDGRFLRP